MKAVVHKRLPMNECGLRCVTRRGHIAWVVLHYYLSADTPEFAYEMRRGTTVAESLA